MKEKLSMEVIPFNDIWFIDCFHMSMIPAVSYFCGNAESIFYNQYFCYDHKEGDLDIKIVEFENIYSKLLFLGVTSNVICLKQENIIEFIIEQLNIGGLVVVGIDYFYESFRADVYEKKHGGHSILIIGYDLKNATFTVIEQSFLLGVDYQIRDMNFKDLERAYNSFVKNKDKKDFFYNQLTEAFMYNQRVPTLCTLISKKNKFNKEKNNRSKYLEILSNNAKTIKIATKSILQYLSQFEVRMRIYINDDMQQIKAISMINNIVNSKNIEMFLYLLIFGQSSKICKEAKKIYKLWYETRAYILKIILSKKNNDRLIKICKRNLKEIYMHENIVLELIQKQK